MGVASIPGAPMSIAWCDKCLALDTVPSFIFDHDFIFVAGGDVTRLVDWARQRSTWIDGKYIKFDEYVKRITSAEVDARLKAFEEAMKGDTR